MTYKNHCDNTMSVSLTTKIEKPKKKKKLIIKKHETYSNFINSCLKYEINDHYSNLMCMKCTSKGPNAPKNGSYLDNSIKLSNRENLKYRCVLPKGHSGMCSHKYDIFKNSPITSKLIQSIDKKIYTTPGNDDFVYKNRATRLYCNVLSKEEELKIRDTKKKKKCAIPLSEASTPLLLAQAYLDWLTYCINIDGIDEHLNKDAILLESIMEIISKNKLHLIKKFNNRKIFDDNGFTMCVIKKTKCDLSDFSDPTRDNRVSIRDSDIQMGHNYPRNDKYVSIRGENLLPQSRRGNLIIGERVFTEDDWVNELYSISDPYYQATRKRRNSF